MRIKLGTLKQIIREVVESADPIDVDVEAIAQEGQELQRELEEIRMSFRTAQTTETQAPLRARKNEIGERRFELVELLRMVYNSKPFQSLESERAIEVASKDVMGWPYKSYEVFVSQEQVYGGKDRYDRGYGLGS